MILDNDLLAADDLAWDGTPTVLDLQAVGIGPGEPVTIFAQGSATFDPAGLTITDGTTDTAATAFLIWACTLAGKVLHLTLPSDVARYIKISATAGGSAGTWTAGIVLPGVQSAV